MHAKSGRFNPFTSVALALLVSGPAIADLADKPESSPEVQVYRAIEAQAMRDDRVRETFDRLARSVCGNGDDSAPASPRRTDSRVGSTVFTTFAKCNVEASLAGSCSKFAPHGAGAWGPIAARIVYIKYFQTLADRANFSPKMLGDDLEEMQYLVVAEISDVLQGKKSPNQKAMATRPDPIPLA